MPESSDVLNSLTDVATGAGENSPNLTRSDFFIIFGIPLLAVLPEIAVCAYVLRFPIPVSNPNYSYLGHGTPHELAVIAVYLLGFVFMQKPIRYAVKFFRLNHNLRKAAEKLGMQVYIVRVK